MCRCGFEVFLSDYLLCHSEAGPCVLDRRPGHEEDMPLSDWHLWIIMSVPCMNTAAILHTLRIEVLGTTRDMKC